MKRRLAILVVLLFLNPGCAVRGFLDFDVDLLLDVPSVSKTPDNGKPRPAPPGTATVTLKLENLS